MMLSIAALSSQTTYHVRAQQTAYYSETRPGERPGEFIGFAAKKLELEPFVTSKAFAAVMKGFDPVSGKKLVGNAGKKNRSGGWDLVFSADKSVSLAWVTADKETRLAIEAALRETIEKLVGRCEEVVHIRVGKAGTPVPAKPIFSMFIHTQNRLGEPQLHVHLICHNLAVTEQGKWGAIVSKPLFENKMMWGALARADFAVALQQRLPGLHLEPTEEGFRVVGVPENVVQHFSQRSADIKAELGGMVSDSARAKEVATLKTRQRKEFSEPFAELQARCIREAKRLGWKVEKFHDLVRRRTPLLQDPPERVTKRAFYASIGNVFRRQSHASRNDVVRFAANYASGRGVSGSEVEQFVDQQILRGTKLKPAGHVNGQDRFTTRRVIRLEETLLRMAARFSRSASHRVTAAKLLKSTRKSGINNVIAVHHFLNRHTDSSYSDGQRRIIDRVTTNSGRLVVVNSMPGQDTESVAVRCAELFHHSGFHVIAAASLQKTSAYRKLGDQVDRRSTSSLLSQIRRDSSIFAAMKHGAKQIVRQAVGKRIGLYPYKWKPLLNKKSVVLVDRAEFLSTQDVYDLVKAVRRSGAKLVLFGCDVQQKSMESGAPFHALRRKIKSLTLKDAPKDKQTSRHTDQLLRGKANELLEAARKAGQLHMAPTRTEAVTKLVDDWFARGGDLRPEHHLIVANTKEEQSLINRRISDRCSELSQGKQREFRLANGEFLRVGDRFIVTAKHRASGTPAGITGTVVGKSLGGIQLYFDDGRFSTVRRKSLHARRAFAVLPHQLPERTGCLYALVGGNGENLQTALQKFSVSSCDLQIYTDVANAGHQFQHLHRSMARDNRSHLATDIKRRAARSQLSKEQDR